MMGKEGMGGVSVCAKDAKKTLELYLHIPFCRQKCLYCDFLSGPCGQETMDAYADALECQIRSEAADYREYEVSTVFWGGGTPSLLRAGQIGRLMEAVRKSFCVRADAEITLECNPGTLNAQKLAEYRKAGINRLSMGLQSADDEELKALGRIHNYAVFEQNFRQAREAGFENINVDLMSALPGQSTESWEKTLRKAAALGAEHISAYSLIIEEGTPFWERYGEEAKKSAGKTGTAQEFPALPTEEDERRMYERTQEILREYGYHRYEISNYAKDGRECRHNIGYWRRVNYLGLGLGASSLVENVRWKVTSGMEEYLAVWGSGKTAADSGNSEDGSTLGGTGGSENGSASGDTGGLEAAGQRDSREEVQELSVSEQMEEFMFLGLRLTDGVCIGDFEEQFGRSFFEIYGEAVQKLEKDGLVAFDKEQKRIRLTAYGTDVSNYALAQFLLD